MSNSAKKDPWTDPDPQPGDFDEYLAEMGPEDIQVCEGNPDVKVVYIGNEDPNEYIRRRRAEEGRNGSNSEPAVKRDDPAER